MPLIIRKSLEKCCPSDGLLKKAKSVEKALISKKPQDVFEGIELEMLRYAEKLTLRRSEKVQEDVIALRASGADDGKILELKHIIGYLNYVNRLLNGRGVTTIGDTVGFYKSAESNSV